MTDVLDDKECTSFHGVLNVVLKTDDADDRFEEGRYVGLNLLTDVNSRDVAQGGVILVVTGMNASVYSERVSEEEILRIHPPP